MPDGTLLLPATEQVVMMLTHSQQLQILSRRFPVSSMWCRPMAVAVVTGKTLPIGCMRPLAPHIIPCTVVMQEALCV